MYGCVCVCVFDSFKVREIQLRTESQINRKIRHSFCDHVNYLE